MIPLYMIKRQFEEESEHIGNYDVGMVFVEELEFGDSFALYSAHQGETVAPEWYSVARFIDYDEAEKFCINKNKEWKFMARKFQK